MTGFVIGTSATQGGMIEISVRAVNGRFLEVRFHLPREYMPLENDLKQILSSSFQRGTLDVFLTQKLNAEGNAPQVSFNLPLAQKYLQEHKSLAKKLKVKGTLSLEYMAQLPNVLKTVEPKEILGVDVKAAKKAMAMACRAAEKERLREGQSLKKEMESLLSTLKVQVQTLESLRAEANQILESKLEQRISHRLQKNNTGVGLDQQRLALEVSLLLERADINEELMRLGEHLRNYQELLNGNSVMGKKLDFYTQELLREVNTIGSKSNLSKLTQVVVEAKTTIERLREQVQNIE